jgi:hypothetical protein
MGDLRRFGKRQVGVIMAASGSMIWVCYGVAQKLLSKHFNSQQILLMIYFCSSFVFLPFAEPSQIAHIGNPFLWGCFISVAHPNHAARSRHDYPDRVAAQTEKFAEFVVEKHDQTRQQKHQADFLPMSKGFFKHANADQNHGKGRELPQHLRGCRRNIVQMLGLTGKLPRPSEFSKQTLFLLVLGIIGISANFVLVAMGLHYISAPTTQTTPAKPLKSVSTPSVGASTAFKACWAMTGSEPQVMVASSANEKPSQGFCFFIFQTAFVYAASQ